MMQTFLLKNALDGFLLYINWRYHYKDITKKLIYNIFENNLFETNTDLFTLHD
jgi:hypothetical protein